RASRTKRFNDKWVYAVVNGRHNHGLSLHPVDHPVHRRRTAAQREAIRQISAIQGVPAGAVPDLLRIQYPEALVTAKDIDNERQLARREALAQKNPRQFRLGDHGQMQTVFWATREYHDEWKQFSEVVSIDTNVQDKPP
ncbi:hypothetical protein E4U51_006051, partial [Claviceps purpurea]